MVYFNQRKLGNPKGQTQGNLRAQNRASAKVLMAERQITEDSERINKILGYLPRIFFRKEARQMFRDLGMRNRTINFLRKKNKKIIFTRIIFVSQHPRIIRIVSIEKEIQ